MSDRTCSDPEEIKHGKISYNNGNQGDVGSLDEKCAKSAPRFRTWRWTSVFFRIFNKLKFFVKFL